MDKASATSGVAVSQARIDSKHHYRFKYLKSEHWSNLRIAKLASVDAKCRYCGHCDLGNDVHHLRYRKLYDVELDDLVVLCRECHDLAHDVLELCRDRIKSSGSVWSATAQLMRWLSYTKAQGVDPSLIKQLGSERFSNTMWWMIKQMKKGVVFESLEHAKKAHEEYKEIAVPLAEEKANEGKTPRQILERKNRLAKRRSQQLRAKERELPNGEIRVKAYYPGRKFQKIIDQNGVRVQR